MEEKNVAELWEFEAVAAGFARNLARRPEGATLVTLSGELGAGKTAFVKAVARALGVEDVVNSPTFVLQKNYGLTMSIFKKLVHIDAYRLESGKELAPLRLAELMQDPGTLIFLEWPEKVAEALPKPAYAISITQGEDGSRTLAFNHG